MSLTIIGYTQTGKPVYINKTADFELYSDFTVQDHIDASLIYNDRRVKYNLTQSAISRSFDIEYSHVSASRNILENELYDFTY